MRIIRRGKLSDLKSLMKFLNETPELQSGHKEETYPEYWVKACLKDVDRDLVLILEDNKNIIGFVIAEIWKSKRYSYLLDIFVVPKYRKQGIATKLMQEYERRCKKLKLNKISMLVLTTNNKMQSFIEKMNHKCGSKFYFYEKRLKG